MVGTDKSTKYSFLYLVAKRTTSLDAQLLLMLVRPYSVAIFVAACLLLLLTGLFPSPALVLFTATATGLLVIVQAILILQSEEPSVSDPKDPMSDYRPD